MEDAKKTSKPCSMRQSWFEHVKKTRKKMSKGKKDQVSHREAMRIASTTWGVEKAKLVKKKEREARKAAKLKAATVNGC